ncbi:hypothetical protein [Streptomyces sp. NRRL WC-3744]|uniref:hypothetical protein n=1 Tax=Streptomyces sp. NRRL WC-3744 TaxID=1463935 RepID=UPI00131C4EA0|nr:hypothetical protein [Streptomyces sp. NRRL WC-3744]
MNDGDVPPLATQYLRSQYWARQALVCGDSAKQRRREAGKLIEGCTLVGAVGLVLATTQAQWSVTTLEAIKSEIAGRRRVEKPVPKISLISGLGGAPQIAQLTS